MKATFCFHIPMTLKEYLKLRKISYRTFAEIVGVDHTYVWRLKNGERRPSPDVALKIEKATKGMVTRMDLLYPE